MEGELLTAVADPLRSGYTFKGWNTAIDGSGATWNFTTITMPAEDIILYAMWEMNITETDDNGTTTAKETENKLPQTGMNTFLIAGVGALAAGVSLILLARSKKRKQ